MIDIRLGENHRITSDSMNYILQERKEVLEGKTRGEEYFINLGYYSTISSLLESYMELCIRNSEAKSMKEILDLVKKIREEIRDLLGGV